METIFENEYVDTYEGVLELNRKLYDPKKIPLGWFFLTFAAVVSRAAVLWRNWYVIAIDVAMAALGLYYLFYHRIWTRWLLRKIKRENNGEIPPAIITVTADTFSFQYKSTCIQFPLTNLKMVFFLEHTIRVVSEDNAFVTFLRTGFKKGSPEELESFIIKNCPQAKRIYKE